MPQYYYKALNSDGEEVEGSIQAVSIQMARAKLSLKKLQVDTLMLETEEMIKSRETLEKERGSTSETQENENQETTKPVKKMPNLTMVEISERIADLTTSRLPLTTGLLAVAENHPNKNFRKSAMSIVNGLEKGQSLDTVLSQHGFTKDYLAIIKAGLYSDNVEKTIQQYMREQNQSQIILSRFLKTFYYPLALFSTILLSLFFFFYWVTPQFLPMYADLNSVYSMELSFSTLLIVGPSKLVTSYPLTILFLLIGFITGMIMILAKAAKPGIVNDFMKVIPFWGRVFRTPGLCRFCYALSAFIDHQVSLPDSFRLAGEASKDRKISFQAHFIANQINNGTPASVAMASVVIFPPLLQQIFQWEEHPKFMIEALKSVGEMEEIQAEGRIGFIVPLIEPLVLLFLGGTFVALVYALFTPLLQIVGMLS